MTLGSGSTEGARGAPTGHGATVLKKPSAAKPPRKKPSADSVVEPTEPPKVTKPEVPEVAGEEEMKEEEPAKKCAEKSKKEGTKRQPAQLVSEEKYEGWTMFKFRRNTSGTPFPKIVSPDGQVFWTIRAAQAAGFKGP